MSEKVSLLDSLPPLPVKKAGLTDGRSSSQPQARDSQNAQGGTSLDVADVQSETLETVASEAVADDPKSITAFQSLTYASFVLNFLLAGAVAVILFKKTTKLLQERYSVSMKAMGVASVLIMLHGFFATYLYASDLSNTPLAMTMAIWILVGAAVGFIARNLLAHEDKPNRKSALIDAGIYGLIFSIVACSVGSGISANVALLLSLLVLFLFIVPLIRVSMTYKVAKMRYKELNETSNKILVYGLLFLPALLPVLALVHACGLGDAVTLLLINFTTLAFILVVGLSMIASAEELIPGEPQAKNAATGGAQFQGARAQANKAFPTQPKPKKSSFGNSSDPIIQFINSENKKSPAPAKPSFASKSKSAPHSSLPRRKPSRPGIAPPKKPGAVSEKGQDPKSRPFRIKAPAKPKKRF